MIGDTERVGWGMPAGLGSEKAPMTLKEAIEILGLDKNPTTNDVSEAFNVIALECHPDKHDNDSEKTKKFRKAMEAKKFLIGHIKGETLEKRAQDLLDKIDECINKSSPEEQKILDELSSRAFALRNDADISEDKIQKLTAEVAKVVDPIAAAFKKAGEDRASGNAGERDRKQQQKDKEQQDRANNASKNQQQSSSQEKEKAERKTQDQTSEEEKTKSAEQTEEQKAENARRQREFDFYIRRKGFVRTGNPKSQFFEMTEKDAGLCCGLSSTELNKEMTGRLPDGFYTKVRDWMHSDTTLHVKDGIVSCPPGTDENDPKTIRAMIKLARLQGSPIVFSAKNPKWVTPDQIRSAINSSEGLGCTINFDALEHHPELGVRDNGGLFSGKRSQQAEILKLIADYNLKVKAGKETYVPPTPEQKAKQNRASNQSTDSENRPNGLPSRKKQTRLDEEAADWEEEELSKGYGYHHFSSKYEPYVRFEAEIEYPEPELDLDNDFEHTDKNEPTISPSNSKEESTHHSEPKEDNETQEEETIDPDHYFYKGSNLQDKDFPDFDTRFNTLKGMVDVCRELKEIIDDGVPESKDDVEETTEAVNEIVKRGEELMKRGEGNQSAKDIKEMKDLMEQASTMFNEDRDFGASNRMRRR